MSDARQWFALPSPFRMKRGGELVGARLAYETWGAPSATRDNALLVLTGLSPSAHAASNAQDPSPGWWEEMIGPGKYIDTNRWFVICVNTLGSCKGSTGPADVNPATGEATGTIASAATSWAKKRVDSSSAPTTSVESCFGNSAIHS